LLYGRLSSGSHGGMRPDATISAMRGACRVALAASKAWQPEHDRSTMGAMS
jgi:hypothetical protein